ncbi:MAG: hypothetical protein IH949_05065 [Bacteroidetes bacterium]|nr:hypothetical protein [Bacteroidota bacterium]
MDNFSHWKYLLLNNTLHLYSHPDLEINTVTDSKKQIVLLGFIFDHLNCNKDNGDILSDILEATNSFEEFIKYIKRYSGRYIFIYVSDSVTNILSDPVALREIYYCTNINRVICGSQPNLIDSYSEPKLGIINDEDIVKFYNLDVKPHGAGDTWVGEETYYNCTKHLMPNHYLNIKSLEVHRYWPTEKINKRTIDEIVDLSCTYLQGVLKSAVCRKKLMMAITAGIDSRTLLACSKELTDDIYFFINKEKHLNNRKSDIIIPNKLCKKLNLKFHVHEIENSVDENFKTIFLNNTFLSSTRIITTIYNIYFKKLSDKLNISGVGEIGRNRYGKEPRKLNGYFLSYKIGYKNSKYVVIQNSKWIEKNLEIAREYNLNPLTLFYWEQKLGNWGAVGKSESDIAIEEFNPYNSHYLFELFLAAQDKFSSYESNILFRKIIQKMRPELLEIPINPPDSTKSFIKYYLKKVRLYKYLQLTKYYYYYLKYRFNESDKS